MMKFYVCVKKEAIRKPLVYVRINMACMSEGTRVFNVYCYYMVIEAYTMNDD